MRLTGSRASAQPARAPAMPPGLVELMEGLAKDVLKNNPENIYEFCAGHMQKLLEIRDGPPPPKKQLSLEQKIAKAQEKIRQRIRDRQNQNTKNMLEHCSESQEHLEIASQNLDPEKQPVVHGKIFNDPDLAPTIKDTTTEEATQVEDEEKKDMAETQSQTLEIKESAEKVQGKVIENNSYDDVKRISEIILDATQEVENKETTETANEVKENSFDNPKEMSDVEAIVATDNEIKADITTIQKLVSKDSTEKVNGDVKEHLTSDNVPQIPDESIVEKENIVNVNQDLQYKDAVVDHAEKVSKNNDSEKIPSSQSDIIVTETDTEEKIINLDQEPLEKEVIRHESNEVTSTEPLANNSETKLTHINDNLSTQATDVIEENKIIKKEEIIDTKHDDILIDNDVNHVKPEEPVVIIDSNEKTKVHQNPEALLPISDNTAAEEVSCNKSHQNETHLNGSQVEPSTDTETPDINPYLEVSVNGAKLEGDVITVKITDKSNPKIDDDPKNEEHLDAYDVQKGTNNTISVVDKLTIDTDDKLPEQERAYSEGYDIKQNDVIEEDTTTANQNIKIFGKDDTNENTAVSGMNLETAAITIQKVFRTFLFSKSRASTLDDTVNENSLDEDIEKKDEPEYILTSANLNKERRTLGISRMDTVLQTVREEKSLSLSDDSSLSSAATTIQAHVRGFLVRNRLASNKTASSSSLVNSDGPSTVSLDGDGNEPKKTILNIHIVPERGQFMSRDESLLTSIDLPLDNSPPSSINLHPLGYDKSERRKQLKREDAVQSISPPSNNSGKLSDEVDSVKDPLSIDSKLENKNISENDQDKPQAEDTAKQENENISVNGHDKPQDADTESCDTTLTISSTAETVVDAETYNTREVLSSPEHNLETDIGHEIVINSSSDEMDVVTPFPTIPEKAADIDSNEKPKLVHSGEFHDLVVQTQVKRTESSVVREFKNVLVYFLLWDKT